jgi:hypothetical protein
MDRQLNKGINNVVTGYPGFDPILLCKKQTIQFGKIKQETEKNYLGTTSLNE